MRSRLSLRTAAAIGYSCLPPQTDVVHPLAPGRHAWIQVIRGRLELNGEALAAGDGASASELEELQILALEEVELLKARGYATAIYGKWHLGLLPELLPTRQGFDEVAGAENREPGRY